MLNRYFYGPKLARHIRVWSETEGHPMHENASLFLRLTSCLASHEVPVDINNLKKKLIKYFWGNIKVLFESNYSVTIKHVREHFRPQTLFQDDAALAGWGPASVPLAVWKKCMIKLIAVGDLQQSPPKPDSDNEMAEICGPSLFEDRLGPAKEKFESSDYEVILMKESYQVHEDYGAFLNVQCPKSELRFVFTDDKQPGQYGPFQNTIQLLFNGLFGKAYNNRMRVAIDVSGDRYSTTTPIRSECSAGTTSHHNEAESDVVLKLVDLLLNFNPNRNSSESRPQVLPKDILIVSPYLAQVVQITSDLKASRKSSGMFICAPNFTPSTSWPQ